MEQSSDHWEPKDLLDRINQIIGSDSQIYSIELRGIYGSSIVIDELIDCLGSRIEEGTLERLILEILPHKNLTELTSHVFEILASKCTNLRKFELNGTQLIKSDKARKVLHEFLISVIAFCDHENLTDLKLIKVASEKSEVINLLQSLTSCDLRNLRILAIDRMPNWFKDEDDVFQMLLVFIRM